MIIIKEKIRTIVEKNYKLLNNISKESENQKIFLKFLFDKRNAALGDSLVNFIYSCTKSIAKNENTGIKISDTILLNGFSDSTLSEWLKLKGKKKEKANALEALILYIWLVYDFTIEDMVGNLVSKLDKKHFNSRTEEITYASKAFSSLFDSFHLILS